MVLAAAVGLVLAPALAPAASAAEPPNQDDPCVRGPLRPLHRLLR